MNVRTTRGRAFVWSAPANVAFGGVPDMRSAATSARQLLSVLTLSVMLVFIICTRARGESPSPHLIHGCPLFFQLLAYSDMPDLRKFGIQPARIIGTGDLWPKGSERDAVPSATEVARGLAIRPANGGPAVLDVEHWPSRGTDAEVAQTVRRLLGLLARVRELEPGVFVGYYGLPPIRDYWRAIGPLGSPKYVEWQHDNDRLQQLANSVNVLFPSLYTFYDDIDGWRRFAIANLSEARRLGGPRPIYAFLWPQFTGSDKKLVNQYLGAAFWRTQLETVAAHADGIVLWGGWDTTGKLTAWDDSAAWWTETRRFIESGCGHV